MNYDEAEEYLFSKIRFGSKLELERMVRLLELLDNPQDKVRVVHIAGTNGKGSVSAMTASVLRTAGYKTGLCTSPHLHDVRERIRINGQMIPKERFAEIADKIKEVEPKLLEEELEEPTYFEFIVAVAFKYYADEKVDFAVMEVGLGGRLDATNVTVPKVSVVTNIELDHAHILGDTVEKIAAEKAAIIKKGTVAVTGEQKQGPLDVIKKRCDDQDCKLVQLGKDFSYKRLETRRCDIEGDGFSYKDVKVQFYGEHEMFNAALAVAVLHELNKQGFKITEEQVRKGLLSTVWDARGELTKKPDQALILVDGAHNVHGILALKKMIAQDFKYKKLALVFGVKINKDYPGMFKEIAPLAENVILTEGTLSKFGVNQDTPLNFIPAEDLKKEAENYCKNTEAILPPMKALQRAIELTDHKDLICVAGSLYMIAELRKGMCDNDGH